MRNISQLIIQIFFFIFFSISLMLETIFLQMKNFRNKNKVVLSGLYILQFLLFKRSPCRGFCEFSQQSYIFVICTPRASKWGITSPVPMTFFFKVTTKWPSVTLRSNIFDYHWEATFWALIWVSWKKIHTYKRCNT